MFWQFSFSAKGWGFVHWLVRLVVVTSFLTYGLAHIENMLTWMQNIAFLRELLIGVTMPDMTQVVAVLYFVAAIFLGIGLNRFWITHMWPRYLTDAVALDRSVLVFAEFDYIGTPPEPSVQLCAYNGGPEPVTIRKHMGGKISTQKDGNPEVEVTTPFAATAEIVTEVPPYTTVPIGPRVHLPVCGDLPLNGILTTQWTTTRRSETHTPLPANLQFNWYAPAAYRYFKSPGFVP